LEAAKIRTYLGSIPLLKPLFLIVFGTGSIANLKPFTVKVGHFSPNQQGFP
jgi:hypothetical protein